MNMLMVVFKDLIFLKGIGMNKTRELLIKKIPFVHLIQGAILASNIVNLQEFSINNPLRTLRSWRDTKEAFSPQKAQSSQRD